MVASRKNCTRIGGEAKSALAKAVFFNGLGEMRDRSFENQRYRASASTWWWLPSFFGTQFTWNARSDA